MIILGLNMEFEWVNSIFPGYWLFEWLNKFLENGVWNLRKGGAKSKHGPKATYSLRKPKEAEKSYFNWYNLKV